MAAGRKSPVESGIPTGHCLSPRRVPRGRAEFRLAGQSKSDFPDRAHWDFGFGTTVVPSIMSDNTTRRIGQ